MRFSLLGTVVVLALAAGVEDSRAAAPERTAGEGLAHFRKRLADNPALRETAVRVKSFFPNGVFFFALGSDEVILRQLQDIKAHGLNTVVVYAAGDIEKRKRLLRMAEETGLKLLLFEDKIFWAIRKAKQDVSGEDILPWAQESTAALSGAPALLGYYLFDEPPLNECRAVGLATRIYENLDPAHIAIPANNLSGGHRGPLRARQDRIGSSVFLYNNYQPLISADNDDPIRAAMQIGVAEAREVADAYDIPLWVVLSAKNETGSEDRRARSLRARIYVALAQGAKGVFYFPYQTVGDRGRRQQGLISPDGTATPTWTAYQTISRELDLLGPLALKLKPAHAAVKTTAPATAGIRVHENGTMYLTVVNLDLDQERTAVLDIDGATGGKAVDALSGEGIDLVGQRLILQLPPGDGRMFALKQGSHPHHR